jgi:hypothetical protein
MNSHELDSVSGKSTVTWKDLLEDYIKNNELTEQIIEEQEKKANEEFLDMIKPCETSQSNIPKFFFKKPITYSDLNYSIKLEAKSRFLSLKSFEIPSKKRKNIYI